MSSEKDQFSDENCEDGQDTDMAKNVLFREGISLDNTLVKKWQDAITRSNVQPSRTSGLPLILWQDANTRLVDIFSTDITAFETISSRTKCMYTKGGWLLFRRFEYPHNTNIASFFLQNAISGARIDLPDMKGYRFGNAAISTVASSPDLVANVSCGYRCVTVVHMIRPGDEDWTMHTVIRRTGRHFYAGVFIKGTKLYCFDYREEIGVFDLIDKEWTFLSIPLNQYDHYVMEFDNEIVKMQAIPVTDLRSYGFYRLEISWEERRVAWVEMSREEWKGRSFFMDDTGVFSVKTEGENLYKIDWPKGLQMVPKGKFASGVEALDLVECTSQDILPFSLISEKFPCWINLED